MIRETIRMAFASLASNKLRTILSMLGIIIGVAAVIAIVSIGSTAQNQVTGQISDLGSNVLQVFPGFGGDNTSREDFTRELIPYIDDFSPDVKNVVPDVSRNGELIYAGDSLQASVVGTSPGFSEVHLYRPRQGRFLRAQDLETNQKSVVLGSEIATELFGTAEPVGKQLKIRVRGRSINFSVVGVMVSKGQGMTGNLDDQVYIPVTTFLKSITTDDYLDGYYAQAVSSERASAARGQLEHFFTTYLGSEDEFRIFSQDQILETIDDVTSTLSLMLGGIAGISLLVGGIGIMNIMLVSVTERTREIGIRKALGAKRKNILSQFLFESLVLSGFGGIIGIGLGWLGTYMVASLGGWPLVMSTQAIVLAFNFSLAVGLFFGIYPAVKASRLDPVDALSYE
ncbi:MAG: ABC transporter permease [Bacillota bacterium]